MQFLGAEAKEATFKSSESLRTIEGKNEDINGLIEKLQSLLKHAEDIKGSNVDNSHQFSDSAQYHKITIP